jgi:peroxiredoxin family protein
MTDTMTAPVPSSTTRLEAERPQAGHHLLQGLARHGLPGAVLANAALAEGIEAHLFFTFWGFDIINKKTMGHLKFSPVGNPATHMPTALMGLPGMQAFATHMMKKQIEGLDIPEVPEFLELITDAGGHLWACKMSADMMHLTEDDLYDGVEGIISAADFIELSEGAQTLFI